MALSNFTIILTDRCNYDCAYCYQPRGRQRLEFSSLVKSLDFFHRYFAREGFVSFYGGEPLLCFSELRRAVEYIEDLPRRKGHKIRYNLTTNGSLLTDRILGFLGEHGFALTLSFDGLAQDISRKRGSFDPLVSLIPRILARPGISLEINSVFSSETVGLLSGSVELIVRMGVPKLDVNFAHKPAWTTSSLSRLKDEMARVGAYFETRYGRWEDVPWEDFYGEPEPALRCCTAGLEQMAISAQGTLWGCAVFPHYFMGKEGTGEYGKYCFGDVDSFLYDAERTYAEKLANLSVLRMDRFSTPRQVCLMCRELEECGICPLAAGMTTGEIGRIPTWLCRGHKMLRKQRRLLRGRFEAKTRAVEMMSSG